MSVRYVLLRGDEELQVEIEERPGGYRIVRDGVPYEVFSQRVVPGLYSFLIDGESYEASVFSPEEGRYSVLLKSGPRVVELLSPIALVLKAQNKMAPGKGLCVTAPMPGTVVRVLVQPGERVVPGQAVVVMEAMKMRNELRATSDGIVREVRVAEGQGVEGGAALVLLDEAG